jgi:hypothetical protein
VVEQKKGFKSELKIFFSNEILWLMPSRGDCAKGSAPLKANPSERSNSRGIQEGCPSFLGVEQAPPDFDDVLRRPLAWLGGDFAGVDKSTGLRPSAAGKQPCFPERGAQGRAMQASR